MFRFIFNTLRPRQNGQHFSDNISKYIFIDENVWKSISLKISLKFVPKIPVNDTSALFQMMAKVEDAYMRHSDSETWILCDAPVSGILHENMTWISKI